MGRIQILSNETINQIAAGEVIENPSSVVKELVENALDAGSKHIFVEIKEGGFQLIRVIDNGCGMSPDEALLSLQRHATSKIRDVHDLNSIKTMGFRGEALASIGAISKLTLTTAITNEPGTKIESEAGKMLSLAPFPRKPGTTIEVRSLFYNVPARKKFQKTSSASVADIHRLLLTLALAHPEVTFEFVSQEKEVFSFKGEIDKSVRVREVLGDDFIKTAQLIDQQVGEYHIKGYLGSFEMARLNRTGQYTFINGRVVLAPLISFAVREGYGVRLDKDRFPCYALHLDMPAHLIDVNVHPQKKEVRFQKEVFLKQMIKEQVERSFLLPVERPILSFSHQKEDVFDWHNQTLSSLTFRESSDEKSPSFFSLKPELNAIGLFKNYLLVQTHEDEVMWVDLHAAEEKMAFDSLTQKTQTPISQGLLIPVGVDLARDEALEIEKKLPQIEKMGFSIRSIGKQSFAIEAIPPCLSIQEIPDVLKALAQEKEEEAYVVAKFARSRKKSFVLQEALALAEKILQQPAPYITPSGALIVAIMRHHDIEHLFRK